MIGAFGKSYKGAHLASEVTLVLGSSSWPWYKASHLWPWGKAPQLLPHINMNQPQADTHVAESSGLCLLGCLAYFFSLEKRN